MKRKVIFYWIATAWLSLGMVSTGIVQLLQVEEEVEAFKALGYPMYLLTMLGVFKLLGVTAVLLPKFALVKEWAYAGFAFCMVGAIASHFAVGQSYLEVLPALLLLVLTIVSWYLRPEGRRLQNT